MNLPKKVVSQKSAYGNIDSVLKDFEDTIVSTLGPMGQTVILDGDGTSVPHVTKDGVTVSESIYYLNPLNQAIATLLKESARKTNEEVGDGTTTSTLLATSLIREALLVKDSELSFREYLDGIERAIDYIIEFLQEETVEITMDSPELKSVISISSNGDEELTRMLVDVTDKVGIHGIIDVRLSEDNVTTINISKGALIDTIVPVIPGPNPILEVDGLVNIILVEGKIMDIPTIENALKYAATNKQTTLIVASEFSSNVFDTVNINNQKGATNIVLAISEGFGNSQLEILKDLSVMTGANILSTNGVTEYPLRAFSKNDAGEVRAITASKKEIILHCHPLIMESELVSERFDTLVEEYNTYKKTSSIISSGEQNIYKKRMAKYVSVATINVGGNTKAESVEKKDRFDDAVHAISAAVNSGVLPGGGSALIRATTILDARKEDFSTEAEKAGLTSIMNTVFTPLAALCSNSGFTLPEEVKKKLIDTPNSAYDVVKRTVVNAFEGGILDPALVLIKGLENATSVMRSIVNSSGFIIRDDGEI